MPLSHPISRRALKHTRAIHVEAFARDDGLWDLDAHITDIKTRDAKLASGVRPAGAPMHDLWLRVTIDLNLTVVDAEAVSDAVPYPGYCDTMSGTAGCTHLSELALVLPTAAIQAFAGEVIDTRENAHPDEQSQKPFQLDRCHALRSDGAAVAEYYPRWAPRPVTGTKSN